MATLLQTPDLVASSATDSLSVLVDGVWVQYGRMGSGPAVVMVHGLVGSGRNFDENVEALSKQATVYSLDLPNMGRSGRFAGLDAGLEASADRLAAFLDAVGVRRATIVGHSHGGAIAMMMAARHPARVKSLVLIAPANPFCKRPKGLIAFYTSRAGALFARTIPWLPRWVYDIAHRRMYVDKRRATRVALEGYLAGMNRMSVEHVLRIVRGWWEDMAKLRGSLEEVAQIPALLLWGDRDTVVGIESGRRLAGVLDAELVVVREAGHLPFAEKPEVCNRAILRWLQTCS